MLLQNILVQFKAQIRGGIYKLHTNNILKKGEKTLTFEFE